MINYAPVLDAASAAGAAIDPFFAGALQEHAAKRAAAFRLGAAPLASPTFSKTRTLGLGGRKPMIGFVGMVRESDEGKSPQDMGRRDAQSPTLLARRSKS